ncbi:MAG: hypothetical protein HY308_14445 [Gammaproteobacteria bacterium]|nr:hypothetical protein [Gammaproteobacteria bacterium]
MTGTEIIDQQLNSYRSYGGELGNSLRLLSHHRGFSNFNFDKFCIDIVPGEASSE